MRAQFAQVGLALLGLTFNHDNEGAQRTSPGLVNVALSNSLHRSSAPDSNAIFSQQNYQAHLYGELSYRLRENSEGQPIPDDIDPDLVDIVYVNATNEFKYYVCKFPCPLHRVFLTVRTVQGVCMASPCRTQMAENKALRYRHPKAHLEPDNLRTTRRQRHRNHRPERQRPCRTHLD
jgi:hypothetical protein